MVVLVSGTAAAPPMLRLLHKKLRLDRKEMVETIKAIIQMCMR